MNRNAKRYGMEDREPVSLAEWEYMERTKRGWTQQDVANRTRKYDGEPYSKSYISAIERGEITRPEPETIDRLAEAFGVNPDIPRLLCGYTPKAVTPEGGLMFSTGGVSDLAMFGSSAGRLDVRALAGKLLAMAEELSAAAALMVTVANRLNNDHA